MSANGFTYNPFMIGYDNQLYEADDMLGFRFPERKVISSKGFASLKEVSIRLQGQTGYPHFLNLGDSSTSGWDSNKAYKGNPNPLSPLFNYKTYSDLLEETIFARVINAGIPGYSSYQGKKYLEQLLREIYRNNARVDYVTLYFGNNDGTYNLVEDKVKIDGKKPSLESRGERVTARDFEKNMSEMIETARDYGTKPIIITPLIHYDWEPGIRSDKHIGESLDILNSLGDCELRQELERARNLFSSGKYKEAVESDRVLPRLKTDYRKAIYRVSKRLEVDMIDLQSEIPLTNNSEYFADYCHPLEKANEMIANSLRQMWLKDRFRKSLKERIKSLFPRTKMPYSSGNSLPNIYPFH